jgi:hypothetical protein
VGLPKYSSNEKSLRGVTLTRVTLGATQTYKAKRHVYMIFTMGAMVQEHPIRQLFRKLDIQYL